MRLILVPVKRNFLSKKFGLILLFEIIFGLLILGSIIPDNLTSKEFLMDPIGLMKIDHITVGLAIGLFVPFVLQYIERLNIFGFQVERRLIEKIDKNFEQAQKKSSSIMYSHEKSLFSITAAIVKNLPVNPRQDGRESVEIGIKNFPESRIFAEIIYHVLNSNNIQVNVPKLQESTLVSFFNLILGKTDMYVEYSGIGFQLSGETPPIDQDENNVKNKLNKLFEKTNLCWLNPISKGENSFNEWIMLKEEADKFNIETISDVVKNSKNLRFGAWPEYFHRASNQESFSRIERIAENRGEKLDFKELKEVEVVDRFTELFDKKIDVTVGWTRDYQIMDARITRIRYDDINDPENSKTIKEITNPEERRKKYDKKFYGIPLHAIPLCRNDIDERVEPLLSKIQISNEDMQELKRKADESDNNPDAIKNIVRKFCRKKNDFKDS